MDVNTRWCPGWIAKLVNTSISTNTYSWWL
jgi:hypothetical protein